MWLHSGVHSSCAQTSGSLLSFKVCAGSVIYTSSQAKTPFSVISPLPLHPIKGARIWKLFSDDLLSPELLSAMFEQPEVVARHDWDAYPVFDPPEQFARFALADGLVYLNAWENAASAMEMSAVSAANGAALVLQHLLHSKAHGASPGHQHSPDLQAEK